MALIQMCLNLTCDSIMDAIASHVTSIVGTATFETFKVANSGAGAGCRGGGLAGPPKGKGALTPTRNTRP